MLDAIKDNGLDVLSVGKIADIFAGQGVTEGHRTGNNDEGMKIALSMTERDFHGLCFVNLVDFDMTFGHRNDVDGYAAALTKFDAWLADFLPRLGEEDALIITADHGCDPSTPSTDHSREHTPMLLVGGGVKAGVDLGTRVGFCDIAATVLEALGVEQGSVAGKSFWGEVVKEG
jgi:phosphopentomutase